jgi:hypothetical protein
MGWSRAANKRWRVKHPAKNREGKKRNYASTATNNPNYRQEYTTREDTLILTSPLTDRQLHFEIGRSVQAIQARRCKLKKPEVAGENS